MGWDWGRKRAWCPEGLKKAPSLHEESRRREAMVVQGEGPTVEEGEAQQGTLSGGRTCGPAAANSYTME